MQALLSLVSEIAAISGVRDGHRNRKIRCDFGALSIADYRCYTLTSFHKNGLSQSKTDLTRGGIAEKTCL